MDAHADHVVDDFPASWLAIAHAWPRQLTVSVAGYAVTVQVTPEDLSRVYLPVLHILQVAVDKAAPDKATCASTSARRVVASFTGVPGAGKSTFAAVLGRVADAVLGMGRLIAVGMDGWHWPNAVLDVRTTTDEVGGVVPLRRRKGGAESFDVQALARSIQDLRSAGGPISLPVYDRLRHDPVPDGIIIGPGTSMVLIEGNYLLSDRPPWDAVSRLTYPRFFIESDIDLAGERVIARHILGGATAQEALTKFESNDRLNTELVLATAGNADYTIRPAEVGADNAGKVGVYVV